MMQNHRFQEYATSGAFTLGLTRNQVSTLDMIGSGSNRFMGSLVGALERKGLVVQVSAPTWDNPDAVEHRLTHAGLLTAALVREAGLTNGGPDPVAAEMETLRQEVERARTAEADAKREARSALARLDAAELDLQNERARNAHDKMAVRILRRDPLPDVSKAELRQRVGASQ